MSVQLPPLHRPPRYNAETWQIGRTGLQLVRRDDRQWRVIALSTAHITEMNWLDKHGLDVTADGERVTFATRTEALRTVAAYLHADPLPEYQPPRRPERAGPDVWRSAAGHWEARRVSQWYYTIEAVTDAARPHRIRSTFGPYKTLASLTRVLDQFDLQVHDDESV